MFAERKFHIFLFVCLLRHQQKKKLIHSFKDHLRNDKRGLLSLVIFDTRFAAELLRYFLLRVLFFFVVNVNKINVAIVRLLLFNPLTAISSFMAVRVCVLNL